MLVGGVVFWGRPLKVHIHPHHTPTHLHQIQAGARDEVAGAEQVRRLLAQRARVPRQKLRPVGLVLRGGDRAGGVLMWWCWWGGVGWVGGWLFKF